MGLLGAALIYGDGVITLSISVLSALEGVNVATTALKPLILPLALLILVALFLVQRFGTAAIGRAFGPIMLVWFIVIGVLGLAGVIRHPVVLQAINPLFGIKLLISSGPGAFLLLGGVFLCATGGEALYADMGHIGRFPIQLAWYAIVLPSLLLSYAGQAGLLMDGQVASGANPFFLLAPSWAVIPLVVLAGVATVIASQAIITGSYSMTRQAMQLGWLPGFDIRQTSADVYGQIYVPVINLLMAVGTILITLLFQSSARLAGAYGTAVSTTMVLTTLLLFRAMHTTWRWPLWVVVPIAGLFLIVDGGFFIANLSKIADGGWIPLALGLGIFTVMITWRTGVQAMREKLSKLSESTDKFLADLRTNKVVRVPGAAVYLTRTGDRIPQYVKEFVHNMGAMHATVIVLNLQFEERPRVLQDRLQIDPIVDGLTHVTLRYGFVEVPDIPSALKGLDACGDRKDRENAVFFGTRDVVLADKNSLIGRIRFGLFSFLHKNSVHMIDRFNLPPERTVEISRLVKL